jgi:TPR repeat protein
MDRSLAAHYLQCSTYQEHFSAQCHFALALAAGDGIAMNKRLAGYYFNVSFDQGNTVAQCNYARLLENEDGIA